MIASYGPVEVCRSSSTRLKWRVRRRALNIIVGSFVARVVLRHAGLTIAAAAAGFSEVSQLAFFEHDRAAGLSQCITCSALNGVMTLLTVYYSLAQLLMLSC